MTAGESHGPHLTAIVSGLPGGVEVRREFLDRQLARRQQGYGRSPRQQMERDRATVTAGLRHGITTGAPLSFTVENRDHQNWSAVLSAWPTDDEQGNWRDRKLTLARPGHADLGGMARGDLDDGRNVLERASARETAVRVGVGAFAQELLRQLEIYVRAHVRAIGAARSDAPVPGRDDWSAIDESQLACLDGEAEARMVAEIEAAKADRDTLGGVLEVVAHGVPPGLGGYVTSRERLDGRLAGATLSVQAMKAVEIGDGWAMSAMRGSDAHDEMFPAGGDAGAGQGMGVTRASNRAGGIEGGMANGAPIVLRVAMKPLPTLMRPLASVDQATGEASLAHAERSDVCAVSAAAIVLEAVVAWELAMVVREQFGMQAMGDVRNAYAAYCERVRFPLPAAARSNG